MQVGYHWTNRFSIIVEVVALAPFIFNCLSTAYLFQGNVSISDLCASSMPEIAGGMHHGNSSGILLCFYFLVVHRLMLEQKVVILILEVCILQF